MGAPGKKIRRVTTQLASGAAGQNKLQTSRILINQILDFVKEFRNFLYFVHTNLPYCTRKRLDHPGEFGRIAFQPTTKR